MSDAYEEGYEAFDNGELESNNPYDLATQEQQHFEWNDGWTYAANAEDEWPPAAT